MTLTGSMKKLEFQTVYFDFINFKMSSKKFLLAIFSVLQLAASIIITHFLNCIV